MKLVLQLVDLRDEIAVFERQYRRWPKSGSVSKPGHSSCEPMPPEEYIHIAWAEEGVGIPMEVEIPLDDPE